MKKRILHIAGGVLLIGAIVATYVLWRGALIMSAYNAKILCSALFISGRAADDIIAEDLSGFGIVSRVIDYEERSVRASVFGLAQREAVYRPGLGATLVIGTTRDALHETGQSMASFNRPPADPENKWPIGERMDLIELPQDIDWAQLHSAVNAAFLEPDSTRLVRTRAVVVVHDGQIVAEKYAPGIHADMPLLGWSMTKSVTHALIGILVRQGKLSLNQPAPIASWQAPGDHRGAITIDQLLRMSSGLNFDEDYFSPLGGAVNMLFNHYSTAMAAVEEPLAHMPGTYWYYSSGTSNLLSQIAREQCLSDAAYLRFPYESLFDKINMYSAVIEPDPSGTYVGSSFMYATARDWARFGLLYLNDGIWNDERILPEGWAQYAATPTPPAPMGRYGAHFWLNAGEAGNPENRVWPEAPADLYYCSGFEGQFVCIIPSYQMIIVRMGLTRGTEGWPQGKFVAEILKAFDAKNE